MREWRLLGEGDTCTYSTKNEIEFIHDKNPVSLATFSCNHGGGVSHRILFMKLYGKYTKFEMSTRIYKKTRGKSQNQLGFTRYLCHRLYGVMMMVLLKPYEYVNQFSQFIQFQ